MFMKLASSAISLFFGAIGFVSMFALNLIGRRGWLPALTGAFFGALGFIIVWFLIIMLLTVLFTEEELKNIFFGKKSPQSAPLPKNETASQVNEYTLDDEEEITISDLYNTPAQPDMPEAFTATDPFSNPKPPSQAPNKAASGLGSGGAFDFQTGDRVLRTNTKEAALAARKVLMNDRK